MMTEELKRLITLKVGSQQRLSELTGIHHVRLNNFIHGKINPNAGEVEALKLVLGPEVASFFNNLDSIATIPEAETALAGLRQMLVEAETEEVEVGHLTGQILELEGKLKSLQEAEAQKQKEVRDRDLELKALMQAKAGHEEARGRIRGRLAALGNLIPDVKKFNKNLEVMAEQARVEEKDLTLRIGELDSKIPPGSDGDRLSEQCRRREKVKGLIQKYESELKALSQRYSDLELDGGSPEKLRELRSEEDHLRGVLANFTAHELSLVASIQELEKEKFASQQADLVIKARELEGTASEWERLQKSFIELAHQADTVWLDIENRGVKLNQEYIQVRGKGKLVDFEKLGTKDKIDHQTAADIGNWLLASFAEEKIALMRSSNSMEDILMFGHALTVLVRLSKRYRV